MSHILQVLYYSVRNAVFFRQLRDDPARTEEFLERLKALGPTSGINKTRELLTDFMLSGCGLTLVDGHSDTIPRGVWLTSIQRDCVSKVREFGYKVGIR